MKAKMTIRDIAQRAGVSTATVSRVLNGQLHVDPATRERIERILDNRRLVSSVAGATPAGGCTGLIGVLVPSLSWGIMSPMLGGIAHVVEQTSHEVVLYNLAHKHERSEIIRSIVNAKQIVGLIAIYPDGVTTSGDIVDDDRHVSGCLSQLHEQGLPIVVVDDQGVHDDTPWISADNRRGAMAAVRHLISLGHRRIAHISGPEPYLCSRDRLEGYRAALEEARLASDPALEVTGDFTASSGWAAAILLMTLPEPPTAVFAANDDMAYGVLTAVRQHGLRVPEDVAVVGFDDAGRSANTQPPLTTIRQPFFDTGWWAATTLLQLVDATPRCANSSSRRHPAHTAQASRAPFDMELLELVDSERTHIELPMRLIERTSTMSSVSSMPTPEPEQVGEGMH